VNGVFAPGLSDQGARPAGLWAGRLVDIPAGRASATRLLDADPPADGFHALNRAAGRDAIVILVDPATDLTDPVHVVHIATPSGAMGVSHPHTIIDAGDGTRLEVIETFCGLAGTAVTNASTTIGIGRDAELWHRRVQVEPAGAAHVGHTRVDQSTGSHLRSTSLSLGADHARYALDVHLHGPSTRTDLDGLSLPTGEQRHDTSITIDHAAPDGTSTQRFRGVVADRARSSFSGHVTVRPGAAGTDASQSTRNLLLSPTAQADARPWLEIFADDVRCTHGATVGRLDDDALFYLRSRGIPVDVGRAMLVGAFVREITDTIAPASLRDHVTACIDHSIRAFG
jgi:Fe-S cluster assembly protein SufD